MPAAVETGWLVATAAALTGVVTLLPNTGLTSATALGVPVVTSPLTVVGVSDVAAPVLANDAATLAAFGVSVVFSFGVPKEKLLPNAVAGFCTVSLPLCPVLTGLSAVSLLPLESTVVCAVGVLKPKPKVAAVGLLALLSVTTGAPNLKPPTAVAPESVLDFASCDDDVTGAPNLNAGATVVSAADTGAPNLMPVKAGFASDAEGGAPNLMPDAVVFVSADVDVLKPLKPPGLVKPKQAAGINS